MKHLKLFESFTRNNIYEEYDTEDYTWYKAHKKQNIYDFIWRKYGIENYIINDDGTINVNGNVDLNLKELENIPLKFRNVSGYFRCSNNKLTSLEGCPESVGGNFSCAYNQLTTLEGCPRSVGGYFVCSQNKITTFEHLPFSIGGYFWCDGDPIYEIWKLFEDYSKIEFLNDCDAVREDNIIILDRLNYFLEEIGKETVTYVKGYKCI